ncbi:MAG: hypothetical protein WBA16_06030 [Nonlabens sp.]
MYLIDSKSKARLITFKTHHKKSTATMTFHEQFNTLKASDQEILEYWTLFRQSAYAYYNNTEKDIIAAALFGVVVGVACSVAN